MIGWQWHQLDHIQIICSLLQTDNHTSSSPLSFYRPDAFPAAKPTASKHCKSCATSQIWKYAPTLNTSTDSSGNNSTDEFTEMSVHECQVITGPLSFCC